MTDVKGGKLLAVIGDQVRSLGILATSPLGPINLQDTCTGFLLGGIGELNSKRQPNFMVVDKGEQTRPFNSYCSGMWLLRFTMVVPLL